MYSLLMAEGYIYVSLYFLFAIINFSPFFVIKNKLLILYNFIVSAICQWFMELNKGTSVDFCSIGQFVVNTCLIGQT